MELGGNAPCIVEDLVPDLDYTIQRLVSGGFYQGGQSCIHMQRLYIHERLYDQVPVSYSPSESMCGSCTHS
jgi:acyl-CoA reductase-like NAD-dependent aldehyde dehydrogenase